MLAFVLLAPEPPRQVGEPGRRTLGAPTDDSATARDFRKKSRRPDSDRRPLHYEAR
jgi:hypothetical protein